MQQQEWYIERERLLGRIKELEAENAELRKRLGEDVMPIERKPSAMQILSLQEKGDLFEVFSKDVRMCLPVGGTARQVGKQATSLYVRMNGLRFATKEHSNVPIVPIATFLLLLIMTSIDILKERMPMAGI